MIEQEATDIGSISKCENQRGGYEETRTTELAELCISSRGFDWRFSFRRLRELRRTIYNC